jgi:hypothetical protein
MHHPTIRTHSLKNHRLHSKKPLGLFPASMSQALRAKENVILRKDMSRWTMHQGSISWIETSLQQLRS